MGKPDGWGDPFSTYVPSPDRPGPVDGPLSLALLHSKVRAGLQPMQAMQAIQAIQAGLQAIQAIRAIQEGGTGPGKPRMRTPSHSHFSLALLSLSCLSPPI
jgi:hypothetical protein